MLENGVTKMLKGHLPKKSQRFRDQQRFKKGEIVRQYQESNFQNQFPSVLKEEQFKQKKFVAELFCRRGYNFQFVKQEIEEKGLQIYMPRIKFVSLMNIIANETFRNLEIFLMEDCQRHMKPLNAQEIRQIQSIMVDCRIKDYLAQGQIKVLNKFIKATYGIQKVIISESEAVSIYSAIYKTMKERAAMRLGLDDQGRKNKKKRFKFKRNLYQKYWDQDLVKQMLKVFGKTHQIHRIKNYFEQIYPEKAEAFARLNLKSKFLKVLRIAFKKAKKFAFDHGRDLYPKVAYLDDVTAKKMLTATCFLQARRIATEIYETDPMTLQNSERNLCKLNEILVKYYADTEQANSIKLQKIEGDEEQVVKNYRKDQYFINKKYLQEDKFREQQFYYDSDQDFTEEESEDEAERVNSF